MSPETRNLLNRGVAIPAHPLALNAQRKLDERRQRALARYYIAAGVGGLAVAVHTTQFEIRDPDVGLFEPVLTIAKEEMDRAGHPLVRVAGVCGQTKQAVSEAELVKRLGYDAGLLSLAAMRDADDDTLIEHVKQVSNVIPVIGFYLQPAVDGRVLPYSFWRRFADEIGNAVAIKIAPFNRYQTIDVVRAIAESGRDDIAIYTGNDDNIVNDLLTTYFFRVKGKIVPLRIVGGLLGHWSVWTKKAVELLDQCHQLVHASGGVGPIPNEMLSMNIEVTDTNAAFFDAANAFRGCIAGLHEVLRRQGLFVGTWCLNPNETMSPGQSEEITRIYAAYPHLNDDAFVKEHRESWLRG